MLVKQFKFKRNNDKGGFQWTAGSEIERPGFYRGFTAVGKTLADVKEFAALVRLCERTGLLERLSEMHPPGWEKRMHTTWGRQLVSSQKKTVMRIGGVCTLWSLAGMARLHPGTQARTSAFVGRFAVVLVNSVDGRYDERGWTYDLGQSPP